MGIYFLLNVLIVAQGNEVIEIGNVYSGEIEFDAFRLKKNSTVEINGEAANFGKSFSSNKIFYGWIINSNTRELVWDARESIEFEDQEGMFSIKDQVQLDPGIYEVYYTCIGNSDININSFGDFFSRIFSKSKSRFKRKYREQLGLTITGEEDIFYEVDPEYIVDSLVQNSIASFVRVKNNKNLTKGFSLNDNTKLRIYSIGESRKNRIFDIAWISNVKTNKIVWKASEDMFSYAGGGKKNYFIDEEFPLPEGSYFLHYNSDDSHSFEEWNVQPPNDPQFWGVTIWAASENDQKKVIPFREEDIVNPIVALTKVGDNKFLSQGFALDKDATLTILCLGEGHEFDELRDYGWIINADSKKIVWTMNDNNNIKHAGGSKKNVMVEEIIKLKKGSYIAYYSTDDSHSYEDWNASSPFQKDSWGLTIWSSNKDIKLFSENNYKSESIITEITKVRNDKDIRKNFSLLKDTKIRILAIGEGDRSEMDDYGWIEDDNENIVWEMSYGITRNAGGAKKNRLFNSTILLEAGNYSLHYKTDGSHSYNSWNLSPPKNQENYGITLMKGN